ncbi:MAG: HNH endonuclease [Bifidobacteriaceae bacterium]|jgi:hypothetical protein|nr:HNH endonuclease [Bifidobacteriaceae bacterium]
MTLLGGPERGQHTGGAVDGAARAGAALRGLAAGGGRGWECLRTLEGLMDQLDQLSRGDLNQLAALLTQVANRTNGLASRVAAHLLDTCDEHAGPTGRKAAARELAAVTGTSLKEAQRSAEVGAAAQTSPELRQELDKGTLSGPKAAALIDGCDGLNEANRTLVLSKAAASVRHGSAWQARQFTRHLANQADPAVTETRRRSAFDKRTVFVEAGEDGMSLLKARLRDLDVHAIMSRLDRAAKAAPASDARTFNQRQADILRDQLLALAPADAPLLVPAADESAPRPASGRRGSGGEMLIVAPDAAVCSGTGPHPSPCPPGWIVGKPGGQVAPQEVRRLVAEQGSHPITVDPESGRLIAVAPRATKTPGNAATPGTQQAPRTAGEPNRPVRAAATPGAGTAAGTSAGIDAKGPAGSGAEGLWTGTPEGANAPHTWMSETLASDTYIPSPLLRTVVMVRDQFCRFPGCDVPATRCDIDHVRRFNGLAPAREQTVASNLHVLCRTHHRAKHRDGWKVSRQSTTGQTVWTSCTGSRHVVPAAVLPAGSTNLIVTRAPTSGHRKVPDTGDPGGTANADSPG